MQILTPLRQVLESSRTETSAPRYQARLANTAAEVAAAQALRFDVFNLELDEGLAQSYDTGLDADPFDAICDHLLVLDSTEDRVVGTYRLQTGPRAAQGLGYYSAREFELERFEADRPQILELGRACIHRDHRSFAVLNLLWKGIFAYAVERGCRYLIGCSSLTSQDPRVGATAHRQLAAHRAAERWSTEPRPAFACPLDVLDPEPVKIPRLLGAYLALGARVCGPPAIDCEFRTIDFLTWIDIESPMVKALQQRGRFAG